MSLIPVKDAVFCARNQLVDLYADDPVNEFVNEGRKKTVANR